MKTSGEKREPDTVSEMTSDDEIPVIVAKKPSKAKRVVKEKRKKR
jgi:hypothetical protein